MKILITGANGYLGKGITNEMLKSGYEIVATDFNIDYKSNFKIIESNIFELEDPYKFFGQPDVVLHLAWRDGFKHYSDVHIDELSKHYTFIKKMAKSGVKELIVMGSMHEIGFFEGSINETTPCNPITPYGISKNALRNLTEMVCRKNNITFKWLRGFYIVGNENNGSSIFSKIVRAANAGESTFPFTTGQNQYDFINFDDFCKQVAIVVQQNGEDGIINICSGKPEKLADRVERFIKENNFKIKLDYGAYPDRPYDSKAIWGDNSKLLRIMHRNYL